MKRYLGTVLVAFVLGCAGPLTVGAAQAAAEPGDETSLLKPVTSTLGALTGSPQATDTGTTPEDPAPEPPPQPDVTALTGPLGAVTTTVSRVADTPRRLLTRVMRSQTPIDPPTPVAPETPATPETPEQPDGPVAEPPADTPTPPGTPDDAPSGEPGPQVPGTPATVAADVKPVALAELAPSQELTAPDAARPAERPSAAEPGGTTPRGPKLGDAADHGATGHGDGTPAEQHKPKPNPQPDVRADAVSLTQVTRTPFVLAIALLTAVGLVTARRVITVR